MQNNFLRYSCQLALPGFTVASQTALQNAKVLIVGAGGLGCPAAQYLTAAGVGILAIADFDTISLSNLHRQILYTPEEVGLKKAVVACNKLQEQNPDIRLVPIQTRITSQNVFDVVSRFDIIVDGTDNFETKYLLNDACVIAGKPLVHGAIYQYEGQVAVWNVLNQDGTKSPHYRDLFPEVDASQIPNCAEGGVIPTLAGIVGCMQANEVIKLITKSGEVLKGRVLIFDALTMQSRVISIGEKTNISVTGIVPTVVVPLLSPNELKICLRNNTIEMIDVRTIEERTASNIGGKHIPVDEIENNLTFIENDKPVVLYCASGKRSGEVAKKLIKRFPHHKIFSLDGGLKAWLEFEKNG